MFFSDAVVSINTLDSWACGDTHFKKALTRLRTIANKLIRELQRKLPTHSLFKTYQKDFLFYQQVIGSALLNAMMLCQLVKAINDFNGKFGIGGVGDVFF
jgi:hypothetical protein